MVECLQQLALVTVVALFCYFKTSKAVSNGCSGVCDYYEWGKEARCQGRNLLHVPQECRQAKTLRLEDNLVTLLPEGAFSNFTCLKYLYLERNGLELQRGSFRGCSSLVHIKLSDNRLPTLTAENMEGLTDKLQVMFIDNTGVVEILPQAFEELTHLQYLSLKDNQLTTPPCHAFSSGNSLGTLYLTNNKISYLPDDCFTVLNELKKLYLKNNPLGDPNELAFRGLVNLKLLDLQYTNLTRVPTGIFPHTNKIETLYLSFNSIPFLKSRDFASLSRLKYLYLQYNSLVSIHAQSFEFLSSLQILELSHNTIRSIEEGALNNLEYLSDLRLHHNKLNSTKNITFSTISPESKVHLSNNPLHCDCSIFPLHYWLKTSTVISSADHIPSSYLAQCSTPQRFHQQFVRDLDPREICANAPDDKMNTVSASEIPSSLVAERSDHNMANAVYAPKDTSSPDVQLIAIVAGCIVGFILIIGGFILLFMKRRSDKRTRRYTEHCFDDKKRPLPNDPIMTITDNPLPKFNPLPELPPRPDFSAGGRKFSKTSIRADHDFAGVEMDTANKPSIGYISKVTPPHSTKPVVSKQSSLDTPTSCQEEDSNYSTVSPEADGSDPYHSEGEVSPAEFVKNFFSQSPAPKIDPTTNPNRTPPPISETENGYIRLPHT